MIILYFLLWFILWTMWNAKVAWTVIIILLFLDVLNEEIER